MAPPRSKPRLPIAALVEDAKDAQKLTYRKLEAGSGVPRETIQSWISGGTDEPRLFGYIRVARFLGLTLDAIADAVLATEDLVAETARSEAPDQSGIRAREAAVSHALQEPPPAPRRGKRSPRRSD